MLLTGQNNVEFERVKPGAHIGRCYIIADLGTQKGSWQGQEKLQRKVTFVWELPTQKMEDGRPFVVSETYTASIGDKAKLKTVLEAWRGSNFTEKEQTGGFDPSVFLGRPAFLSIVEGVSEKTGKKYSNINSIMQLPEGVTAPAPVNGPVYFSLDNFNETSFNDLPEWIQKKIKESPEYQAVTNPNYQPAPVGVPGVDYPTIQDDGFSQFACEEVDAIPF